MKAIVHVQDAINITRIRRTHVILGYDWHYGINSDKKALNAGSLSLGWADYLFGPSLLIPGIIDIFQLKQ